MYGSHLTCRLIWLVWASSPFNQELLLLSLIPPHSFGFLPCLSLTDVFPWSSRVYCFLPGRVFEHTTAGAALKVRTYVLCVRSSHLIDYYQCRDIPPVRITFQHLFPACPNHSVHRHTPTLPHGEPPALRSERSSGRSGRYDSALLPPARDATSLRLSFPS